MKMLNSLDLMLIVVMGMATLSLLALCLMFFVRNKIVKKVAFYLVAIMGVYVCTVGLRIFSYSFPLQSALSILLGLSSIGAIVLERFSKRNEKLWNTARILAAVALVVGFINAFS